MEKENKQPSNKISPLEYMAYGALKTYDFVKDVAILSLYPYAPKTIRKIDEANPSPLGEGGMFFAGLTSLMGFAAQGAFYYNNPKYLAIPIATNIASLVYEGIKESKDKYLDNIQSVIKK